MQVIMPIIEQHAEEAAFLWLLRTNAVHAPHYTVKELAALDERVEAHIDGLRISGEVGWSICEQNLSYKEPGEVFAAGVLALESRQQEKISRIYASVEEEPTTISGLISAFGWVEQAHLSGIVNGLLISADPFWRSAGIAVCAAHRVDPGEHLIAAMQQSDLPLKLRGIRTAGEMARTDLVPLLKNFLDEQEKSVQFWCGWALSLLGERNRSLHVLQSCVQGPVFRDKALQLLLRVANPALVKDVLGQLVKDVFALRSAIKGAGASGDALYLPWLIKHMENPEMARVAGESFSLITGVDIAYDDLDTDKPDGFEAGPTENPEDDNTQLDEDEDLAWPDPALIQGWWEKNSSAYQVGQRYLLGQPVSEASCQTVLRAGKQRQRQAAAMELALMRPETILFETRMVGKRQQQRLNA